MTTTTPAVPVPSAAPSAVRTPVLRTVLVLAPPAMLATGQLYLGIPLVPSIAGEWGVEAPTAMSVLSTFGIGYAAGVLLFGMLVDRIGARRVMTYGLLAAAVATLAVTLARGTASGYALRALQGLATGAFPPAAFAYVGMNVPAERRGVVLASLTGGFLAAGGLLQVAGQGVLAVAPWRTAFFAAAALMVLASLAIRLVLRPDPAREPGTRVKLTVTPQLIGLWTAALTLLVAFVALYTTFQLSADVDRSALPWIRLSAVPAVVLVPFLLTRLRWAAPLRAAAGLALVTVTALAVAALGTGAPAVALALGMFVLTFGVALAAPSLAEAVGMRSGAARALGAGIFNAALLVGASVTGPVSTALNGLSTSAVIAAVITAAGAGVALAVARAK
ncbi:hypothetical protein Afil01_12960 [Actinorhabdospora filicis]|uniref:Major facilitator superfamily (MFS) profile domain-containing protein n=1 Tax=Actinorhabdospora filicis TaxID=1785913 RepID=A0A9W6W7E9_9ACTN|nr:MFS transporter [Actinorhabdospora filicis]GLZ76489.1 hypothetical protein Afil01_12960 [Actinorhabdospora filicis]